jgi:hypothetical protein
MGCSCAVVGISIFSSLEPPEHRWVWSARLAILRQQMSME